MTKKTSKSAHSDELREPDELLEQVEHTREELGETVAQLAAKADLKERARGKLEVAGTEVQQTVAQTAQAVREHTPQPVQDAAAKVAASGQSKPAAVIGAAVAAVAAITAAVLRRRKNSKGRH